MRPPTPRRGDPFVALRTGLPNEPKRFRSGWPKPFAGWTTAEGGDGRAGAGGGAAAAAGAGLTSHTTRRDTFSSQQFASSLALNDTRATIPQSRLHDQHLELASRARGSILEPPTVGFRFRTPITPIPGPLFNAARSCNLTSGNWLHSSGAVAACCRPAGRQQANRAYGMFLPARRNLRCPTSTAIRSWPPSWNSSWPRAHRPWPRLLQRS